MGEQSTACDFFASSKGINQPVHCIELRVVCFGNLIGPLLGDWANITAGLRLARWFGVDADGETKKRLYEFVRACPQAVATATQDGKLELALINIIVTLLISKSYLGRPGRPRKLTRAAAREFLSSGHFWTMLLLCFRFTWLPRPVAVYGFTPASSWRSTSRQAFTSAASKSMSFL